MTARHSLIVRLLHWATACAVAAQFGLITANFLLYEIRPILAESLVQAHISVGALIVVMTVTRIGMRLTSPTPLHGHKRALRFAAAFNHLLLYVCLIALPLTGYLKLAALGFSVKVFGFLHLPALPLNIPFAQGADRLHDSFAMFFLALLALHISAALFHSKIDGVNVMKRISITYLPMSKAKPSSRTDL